MEYLREVLSETRRTVALAGPIIIGQIGQHVLHVIDAVMIGHLGRVPLAASAFAGGVITFLMIVAIGLLVPVSVLTARAAGLARPETQGEILRHGVVVAAVLGLLVALVTSLGVFALRYLGQPPEVEVESRAYFVILGWSALPALVFQAQKQFCEGCSRPTSPMVIMLASVVLNVALNWVLIFGHLGVPALGLAGAGWATLLARIFAAVALFGVIAASRRFATERPRAWAWWFDCRIVGDLLRLGFPIALQLLFEVGLFTAAAILMGWLGTVQLAAHQIALSCIALIFMVPLGMSIAVGVRAGRAAGENDIRRLRIIGHGTIASTLLFMALSAAGLFLGGAWIASWFVDDVVAEAPVVELAATLLGIAALFQMADGLQVVSIGILRGLLDVKIPTAINFVAYWVVAMPLAYGGGFVLGFDAVGVWAGLAAGLAVSAIALTVRFEVKTRVMAPVRTL